MGYLIKRLREEGIIGAKTMAGARQTMINWLRAGILKLRTKPNTKHRVVNEYEVEEIVKTLKPGGKGKWEYKKQDIQVTNIKVAQPKVSKLQGGE